MAAKNRLSAVFGKRERKLLAVYFTAGFPELHDTVPICQELEKNGVDLIEMGVPFSDSLVDGPTIQASHERALKNGMTLEVLFGQLAQIRTSVSVPLVLMSSLNPILCYSMERFAADCRRVGVDGVIIPDLPPEYFSPYAELFAAEMLSVIFLVTAHTPVERIRMIDKLSSGFIYAVSSDAVTGSHLEIGPFQEDFFKRLAEMGLDNPFLVGFGVSDSESFRRVAAYSHGVIVGSAFIRALSKEGPLESKIAQFVSEIRPAVS